ncbi:MAG: hypothetical protein IPK17_16015 [Chloroflexi bacterium]|uniref:hypothetical protein n=1 Tax=Candidatus Flexifilum breve TaxID=3140694 RepID=UPI0031349B7F|nr:hypothetical protein [Chloroflexota bacterium]
MQQTSNSSSNVILKFLLASLLVYALMGVFSGVPASADFTAFIAGLIILFVGLVVLLSFGWYAVVKPLPVPLAPSKNLPLPRELRQGVALALTLLNTVGIIGGLWDVTWHVRSGLPFGEDFFWEPHQFIYVALIVPILIGGFLWVRVLRNSSGTLRQRLQADIPVTLIIFGSMLSLFTLPADPLWHVLYGEDLTGMSVPHLVFSVSSTITAVGVLSILLSYTPARQTWASILNLSRLELLIVFSLALMFVSLLIPMLGDWEAVVLAPDTLPRLPALVEARPDWALPFLAAFAALFPTTMALHITKRFGMATFLWLIASVVRSGSFLFLGYGDTGLSTMLLTLPLVIALDVAVWYRVSRGQALSPIFTALVVTVVGTVAVLPQIPLWFTIPILSASNVPLMIPALFVGAFVSTWMAGRLGDVVATTPRFAQLAEQPIIVRSVARLVSVAAVVIAVIAAFFIVTSTMPGA